jgi:hypothetical protein
MNKADQYSLNRLGEKMEINFNRLFWLVIGFLFYSSIIHEAAHAFVALLFGYHVLGVHFGFPISYVLLDHCNWVVYLSGGLVNGIGLLAIWKFGREYFSAREQFLMLGLMLFQFGYSLFEAFIYPNPNLW